MDDEEATLAELNCLCGTKHNIFFGVKMPKRRLPVQASTSSVGTEETLGEKNKEVENEGIERSIMSKILSHFVKGKISFIAMEIFLIVLGELEYLKGFVKLARKRKDVEAAQSQVATIIFTTSIKRVYINKTNQNKTLHLVVEIDQALLKRPS